MNIIALRKFIWSFTRLKDLKSALQTLHHMVDLAKEHTSMCKTVEGKFYCPQLDIPIPSISAVDSSQYKDQHANSDSFDDEGLRCKLICLEDDMESSTRIRSLKGPYKNPIEVILRWSFNDVIYACAHLQNAELAQKLILQVKDFVYRIVVFIKKLCVIMLRRYLGYWEIPRIFSWLSILLYYRNIL